MHYKNEVRLEPNSVLLKSQKKLAAFYIFSMKLFVINQIEIPFLFKKIQTVSFFILMLVQDKLE